MVSHVSSILGKLLLASRVQAAVRAMQEGLVRLEAAYRSKVWGKGVES